MKKYKLTVEKGKVVSILTKKSKGKGYHWRVFKVISIEQAKVSLDKNKAEIFFQAEEADTP